MDKVFAGLIVIIMFAVIIVPITLLRGYAMYKCWGWFMVPTFGLPTLSIIQALGVGLTVGVLHPHPFSSNKDDEEKWYKPLVMQLLYPIVVLAVGYIYHCFM